MKKVFIILSMFLSLAVACDKNNTEVEEPAAAPTALEFASETIAGHNTIIVKPEDLAPSAPVVIIASEDIELTTRTAEEITLNFKAAEHCLIGRYILCIVESGEVSDASFLTEIRNAFPSTRKAYLVSYCNGLAYTAAMQMPDTFNAYACVSATINPEVYAANSFTKPVSFVHVHATGNSIYKWNGVEGKSAAAPLSIGAIVAVNECTHYTTTEILPRKGKGLVSCTTYLGGLNGHQVKFYTVEGASNGWCDAEFEVYNQIWNFFKTR